MIGMRCNLRVWPCISVLPIAIAIDIVVLVNEILIHVTHSFRFEFPN